MMGLLVSERGNDHYGEWDGLERRTVTRSDIALMVTESVDERIAETETRIINHVNQSNGQFQLAFQNGIQKSLEELKNSINQHIDSKIDKLTKDAFPEGPLYKHKEFHENRIKNAENNDKIRTDLMSWAFKGVIGLVIFLIGIGALEWLKREMSK